MKRLFKFRNLLSNGRKINSRAGIRIHTINRGIRGIDVADQCALSTPSHCKVEMLEGRVLLSGITSLASFDGTDGRVPLSGVIVSGSTLYGTTSSGGANDDGVVFSLPIGGGTPTVLGSFDGSDGAQPEGSLLLSGNTLYGTTESGGADGDGRGILRTDYRWHAHFAGIARRHRWVQPHRWVDSVRQHTLWHCD